MLLHHLRKETQGGLHPRVPAIAGNDRMTMSLGMHGTVWDSQWNVSVTAATSDLIRSASALAAKDVLPKVKLSGPLDSGFKRVARLSSDLDSNASVSENKMHLQYGL